ncbi:TetR/AcrR family transcriptional regulator [Streptomyces sp. NPDC091272]|uniref:TetR/AcrR family transcriptional regulator n=1 Tax=Streptomyces sp. NPDC091272 TaxID=3365981 RepID=UPI00380198CE
MAARRADARRNYARILAAAVEEVALHGADASLEQIARTAEVGSATVRRHFPSRPALLEAVFHERIETLDVRARELLDTSDARAALLEWLTDLTVYAASARGLAAALTGGAADVHHAAHDNACTKRLAQAGGPLLARAAEENAVAPGVSIGDLLTLVAGIALATEHHPGPVGEAQRLLGLAVQGLSPRGPGTARGAGNHDGARAWEQAE